ncbi:proprotein convertase P-domain-containing protein [Vibrio cholerae]|uniref:zinc-dependent metalloprotease family protein n=1 Tax=Vibrio cholerae TaxID=666 RepID=UPI00005F3A95|nr:zinc-dependent metalloprotease family protein [Vibrio cholerae]EFH74249.1 proprotein convertase P-domain-containing protein [Vibrio cholerae RC385]EGQ9890985.1 endo-1,4-beta-xylanase [Vibrio cholerae]EHD2269962.1 endo-1,4-beta-xylanase [Vibrio cholerae]EIJ2220257.1 proprotein convertase P-domain-containing protein [Vibrio cholerae]EJL6632817.1 proprotein convertase P-domain-containing protein [Vibrio cholerae]
MKKASLALAVSVGLCSPAIWATTQIDVLGLYTPDTAKGFKQEHVAQMQHSVNVANKVLKDSGLDIKVNLAATKEVQYDTQPGLKKSQDEVLDAATPFNRIDPAFADVEAYRQQIGADMVAIFRYLDVKNSPDYKRKPNGRYSISCGLAWIVGPSAWNEPQHAKKKMYSHSYLNECGSEAFIHELGHNLGLNHAHEQYKNKYGSLYLPHESNGTEQDAYGYGVNGQFATIMAYPHLFGFGVQRSFKFSSPDLLCEGGAPCGEKDYANSVRAIGLTAPLIANAYASASTPVEGGTPEDTEPTTNTDKVFVVKGPVALPDKQILSLPIKVSAQTATTAQVAIDLTHEYRGDLSIVLYAPDDSYWILKKANRYDRNQSYNMKINLTEVDPLATEGEWRLEVQDHWAGKVGTLNSFQITFP